MPVRNDARWDPEMLGVLKLVESEALRAGPVDPELPFAWQRERLDAATLFANDDRPDVFSVSDVLVPARGRRVQCRLYRPSAGKRLPTVVFFHGGGWVRSSIQTHDRLAREIALASGAVVISVDYALSPEAHFPHALEECADVTRWLRLNAGDLDIDTDRLAVAGDSAGGNLALGTALFLRDRGDEPLRAIVTFYPVCDFDFSTPSYQEFAEGCFLTRDLMRGFWEAYAPGQALRHHSYAAPLRADLTGLPPTLVQLANMDVLFSEGEALATKLKSAGVDATCEIYKGMAHGFIRHTGRVAVARAAMARMGEWLRPRLAMETPI